MAREERCDDFSYSETAQRCPGARVDGETLAQDLVSFFHQDQCIAVVSLLELKTGEEDAAQEGHGSVCFIALNTVAEAGNCSIVPF